MKLGTYLYFPGTCREAFSFYEQATGGKIVFTMTYDEAPPDEARDPAWGDKIMHAAMQLGGQVLMASDAPPQHYQTMSGFSVSLEAESVDDAKRIFAALAEGGQVRMPIAPTFWSPMFGMCKDRFGTPWMVSAPGEP